MPAGSVTVRLIPFWPPASGDHDRELAAVVGGGHGRLGIGLVAGRDRAAGLGLADDRHGLAVDHGILAGRADRDLRLRLVEDVGHRDRRRALAAVAGDRGREQVAAAHERDAGDRERWTVANRDLADHRRCSGRPGLAVDPDGVAGLTDNRVRDRPGQVERRLVGVGLGRDRQARGGRQDGQGRRWLGGLGQLADDAREGLAHTAGDGAQDARRTEHDHGRQGDDPGSQGRLDQRQARRGARPARARVGVQAGVGGRRPGLRAGGLDPAGARWAGPHLGATFSPGRHRRPLSQIARTWLVQASARPNRGRLAAGLERRAGRCAKAGPLYSGVVRARLVACAESEEQGAGSRSEIPPSDRSSGVRHAADRPGELRRPPRLPPATRRFPR